MQFGNVCFPQTKTIGTIEQLSPTAPASAGIVRASTSFRVLHHSLQVSCDWNFSHSLSNKCIICLLTDSWLLCFSHENRLQILLKCRFWFRPSGWSWNSAFLISPQGDGCSWGHSFSGKNLIDGWYLPLARYFMLSKRKIKWMTWMQWMLHWSILVKVAMPLAYLSCNNLPWRSQYGCSRPTWSRHEAHGWLDILISVFVIAKFTPVILIILFIKNSNYHNWPPRNWIHTHEYFFFLGDKSKADLFSTSQLIPPRDNLCWVKNGRGIHGLPNSKSYLLRFLYKQVLWAIKLWEIIQNKSQLKAKHT